MILLIDFRADALLPCTTFPRLSAAQTRTLLLAEALAAHQEKATIICHAGSALALRCAAQNVPHVTLPPDLAGFSLYLALRRQLRRSHASIVHVFGVKGLAQAAWLRRSPDFQLVLTPEKSEAEPSLFRRRTLSKVDAFVLPSHLSADGLNRRATEGLSWMAPRQNGTCSLPPLVRAILPCALPVEAELQPLCRDSSRTAFLAFSHPEDEHGTALFPLLKALARLKENKDAGPCELRIVGPLPDFDALRDEAQRLHIADSIALLGRQPVSEVMNAADAVIIPDQSLRAEVMLSAWSYRKAVIAVDLVIYKEVTDGRAYLPVSAAPDQLVDGLARAMFEIIRHPSRRSQLSAAGTEVLKRLTPEIFYAAHHALYADVKKRLPALPEEDSTGVSR